MTKYILKRRKDGCASHIETSFRRRRLLQTPLLNKGSAFSSEERANLELQGLLPPHEETLEQQAQRMYACYQDKQSLIGRHVFLRRIHDNNYVLFYYLVKEHLEEMLPVIYTPTIGEAVQQFSHLDLQPRGLYIAYPERDQLDDILAQYHDMPIQIIIMTDGEGVLGIGDQGVGGINIVMAKGSVYSLCAGVDPATTLPIQLDCGTNNQALLHDPDYLGWHHKRITGDDYNHFVEDVVAALQRHFPGSYLHWEDFGRANARRFLEQYKHQICTFNDDIQGTGAVTLATLLTAMAYQHKKLTEQHILIFGAGTAGIGIADQLHKGLVALGLSAEQAYGQIWLIDRPGLLTKELDGLTPGQLPYAKDRQNDWPRNKSGQTTLQMAIPIIQPTILIGCSAQGGSFTEPCIQSMLDYCDRPMIMPLSNPTNHAEATPADLMNWTQGKAFVATGSPFADVHYQDKTLAIAQCNNVFIFPGLGLGASLCQASHITDEMLMAACKALADFTYRNYQQDERLLPKVTDSQNVNKAIAAAVIQAAIEGGQAKKIIKEPSKLIEQSFWIPKYLPYKPVD